MNRVFGRWSSRKSKSPIEILAETKFINSALLGKHTRTFGRYLKGKETQKICLDLFFHLLTQIDDERYLNEIFQLITQSIGFRRIPQLITTQVQSAIHQHNFDLCHKLLYLPYPSTRIPLPTYEIISLIHHCSNFEQLSSCLSKLIERNLPFDPEYPLWILMILFEHYQIGDELIIDYLLKCNSINRGLIKPYGSKSLTPLMLFFHLFCNDKCQQILDAYLSNLGDLAVLNQVDQWNRSYLTHLLSGKCQHGIQDENERCPHEDVIFSRFVMLDQVGNRCENLAKTILRSEYCLSLRMSLINYLIETNRLMDLNLTEFFLNFPWRAFSLYSNQVSKLMVNRNLDSTLENLIQYQKTHTVNLDYQIKYLLQHGARLANPSHLQDTILHLLLTTQSLTPHILLDFSFPISIPFDTSRNTPVIMYVIRTIQCGYPNEFQGRFEEFKSSLPKSTAEEIEAIPGLQTLPSLKKICLQKLRKTLPNLGDETIDELKDSLRTELRHSIRAYGYDECYFFFKKILLHE